MIFEEQLRRGPNAWAHCKHWLLNLKQVLELLYESQILSRSSLWLHETPVLRHRKHFTSESFCLVVVTSPSIYLSPPHCHDRLILAGVLSCCYNPKTKSCLPATMSATVSVLEDLRLWQFPQFCDQWAEWAYFTWNLKAGLDPSLFCKCWQTPPLPPLKKVWQMH